jgi:hypothetical protein
MLARKPAAWSDDLVGEVGVAKASAEAIARLAYALWEARGCIMDLLTGTGLRPSGNFACKKRKSGLLEPESWQALMYRKNRFFVGR